jgi:hypothetical protein
VAGAAVEGSVEGAAVEGEMVGAMEGSAVVGCTVLTLVRTTITQRRRANVLNGACMAQIAYQIKSNERIMRCSLLDMR